MKSLIITTLALASFAFSTSLQAQNTLENRFGEDAINSIQGSEKLEILQFQNQHGYYIQDLSGVKDVSEYPDALEIAPVNENTPALTEASFNNELELFAYAFPLAGKTNLYYRVGNTGKLMIIYSLDIVKKKFTDQSDH